MRLDRGSSFLLVVDVQEKLAPHVEGHERLIRRAGALVRAAKLLGLTRAQLYSRIEKYGLAETES